MSRDDYYFEQVKAALKKAGWQIAKKALAVPFAGLSLKIDIEAHKDDETIAVEVKSFVSGSPANELHKTRGQYANYRDAIDIAGMNVKLYLAIPDEVYTSLFSHDDVAVFIQKEKMRFIVFNPNAKQIVKWQH